MPLIDIDVDPWKAIPRWEIKPPCPAYTKKVKHHAIELDTKLKPLPNNWNTDILVQWLPMNPIQDEQSITFIVSSGSASL